MKKTLTEMLDALPEDHKPQEAQWGNPYAMPYQKGEYCKATDCGFLSALMSGDTSLCSANCGAYDFHGWLQENGYRIEKAGPIPEPVEVEKPNPFVPRPGIPDDEDVCPVEVFETECTHPEGKLINTKIIRDGLYCLACGAELEKRPEGGAE